MRGLAEVLVGYRLDPQVGPVIAVGVGGVLAEIYRDITLAIAPVTVETAGDMIDRVRGLAPIRGYRNLPKGDVEALAKVIARGRPWRRSPVPISSKRSSTRSS